MGTIENIRLGEVIEQLIKDEPGLTITRLADEVGANRNSLDNIVSANAIPRGLKTVIKLAERFGLSLDQIVFGNSKSYDFPKIKAADQNQKAGFEVYLDGEINVKFIEKIDK